MKTTMIGGGPGGLWFGTKGRCPLVLPRCEMHGPQEAS